MNAKFIFIVVLSAVLSLSAACKSEKNMNSHRTLEQLENVSPAQWEKLSNTVIYFGHQSVGGNIMEGIADLNKDLPQIGLRIQTVRNSGSLEGSGVFAHSWIGKNGSPESKMRDFLHRMEGSIGDKTSLAFFKFCYIDFSAQTDVGKIFGEYKRTMQELKMKFPKTTFIHVTVPLVSRQSGIKDLVKKILGRSVKNPKANLKRNEYNDLLRSEYEGKDPIYDLAACESTYPDGTRETFKEDGKSYYALVPQYTDDGGHLNAEGRKVLATDLLLFLSKQQTQK